MAHDIMIASKDTVGELVSDFVVYFLCDLASVYPLVLMLLSHFSLNTRGILGPFIFSNATFPLCFSAVVRVACVVG